MSKTKATIPLWYPVTPAQEQAEVHSRVGAELAEVFAGISLMVLDADGIMTTGEMIYGPGGEAFKTFTAQDGLGLVIARAAGIRLAVLSGRKSEAVARRCRELHFDVLKLGCFDKAPALDEIFVETGCSPEETLYMGDDVIDLAAMTKVHLAVTVPEAPPVVREACRYVTSVGGGRGAVREAIDLVLKSRGAFGLALGMLGAGHAPTDDVDPVSRK